MTDKQPDYEVLGRLRILPRGGLVFLGSDMKGQTDALFIAFRNQNGDDTKITLSPEAMDVLVDLRRKQKNGFVEEDLVDFPHKRVWKVVRDSRIDDGAP